MKISPIQLREHDQLLQKLDEHFRLIRAKYADQMQCGQGCARCCYGLFDITVLDALRVAKGLETLPQEIAASVARRASAIQNRLINECADLRPPYLLDSLPQERIDRLVDAIGEVRCPFLDSRNACLIYDSRPVACRLEGMPMIDTFDGLFSDWCELNFQQGIPAEMENDLKLDYYGIQAIEQDTAIFIPSVIYAMTNGRWPFHRTNNH